jgi:hypothetical protein
VPTVAVTDVLEIHVAGWPVQYGPLIRQRCAWCGAMIEDLDLRSMAFPIPHGKTEDQARADGDLQPGSWPPGALVARDGPVRYVLEHIDGDGAPAGSCLLLDPDVTR